jgi:hypothetical protein
MIFTTINTVGISYINSNQKNMEIVLTQWTGGYYIQSKKDNESCKLYCHIPIIHNGQSPIIITDVWSEPINKVSKYKIKQNYSGKNALLEISFEGLSYDEFLNVFFNVSTIIKRNDYDDMPRSLEIAAIDELPDYTKKWLNESDFIQCTDWRISLLAQLLKGFNNDVIKTANRVAFFTGKIIRYKGFGSQDALSTLQRLYAVCTGKADLGVALMRANGIPARVIMVFPTHYIIEFYAYPYGWIRAETTIGRMPYSNQKYTVSYCAEPIDETPSNEINGESPYAGVIAYWGCSNTNILWGIEYNNWKMSLNYQLSSSYEKIEQAVNKTMQTWFYFMDYTGLDLNHNQINHYNDALNFKEEAIKCFKQDDIDSYIENIGYAINAYDKI